MKRLKKVLVLGFVVLIAGLAEAADIYVPGNYATIQAAVNAANPGDRIYVSAGTYTEAVYVNKGIALVGKGTPTITASGISDTNTVTFDGNATNNASISGFIITGAPSGYRGISCNNGSQTITNNTISGNDYGIYCFFSFPSITNNTITGNGIGIYCWYSSPSITNNTISGNSYGIYCYSSLGTITNNIITGNDYNGIFCYSSSPTINYNCVWNNGSGGSNNYYGCFAGSNDTGKELEAEKKRQNIERLSKEIGISKEQYLWLKHPIGNLSGLSKVKVKNFDLEEKGFITIYVEVDNKEEKVNIAYNNDSPKDTIYKIKGVFYTKDPSVIIAKWGKRVLKAIKEKKVFIGQSISLIPQAT